MRKIKVSDNLTSILKNNSSHNRQVDIVFQDVQETNLEGHITTAIH
jgi:hypothetical protein